MAQIVWIRETAWNSELSEPDQISEIRKIGKLHHHMWGWRNARHLRCS